MTSVLSVSSKTMDYSEEDLEFDCDLLMSETEDINMNWMNVVLTKKTSQTREEMALIDAVDSHAKALRYLNFAKSVVDVEISKLTTSDYITGSGASDSDMQKPHTFDDLPASFIVKDIIGIDNMIAKHETLESRRRQLKKDVERDVLLINGVRICGAQNGLDSVLQLTGDIVDQMLKECDLKLLGPEARLVLSETILSVASRTHSGGITFQALHSLIDSSESMLIPQSAAARPIRVQISVGSFPDEYYSSALLRSDNSSNTTQKWGIVCQVTCESLFQIQNRECPLEDGGANHPGMKDFAPIVRVVYQDYILLDLMQQMVYQDYILLQDENTTISKINGDHIICNTKELGTVILTLN